MLNFKHLFSESKYVILQIGPVNLRKDLFG